MTSRGRRTTAELLSWVYVLATLVAAANWAWHRVVPRPARPWWLQELFVTVNVPVTPSLVSVVGLALLSAAILKRKRLALAVVCLFQVVGAASDVLVLVQAVRHRPLPAVPFGDIDSVPVSLANLAVSLALLGLVGWLWPAFPARVRRGSWALALAILGTGLLLDLGLTHLLVRTATDARGPAWQLVAVTLLHAVGLPVPHSWQAPVGHVVPQVSAALAGLSLLLAVGAFVRSAGSRGGWRQDDEVDLRALLAQHGEDDSLGYYATRRDKQLYFSASRRATIAYRVVGSVCLASSDPLGDPRAWPDLVREWEHHARTYGWTPAVLACSEAGARAYAAAVGLEVLNLGDEAVLEPDRFRLDSTTMTPVRRAVRRARRSGLSVEVRRAGELDADELDELRRLADTWRVGGTERGFSMALGRFGDPSDAGTLVVVARDGAGRPVALQTFVPWGRRGLSLDLMRRGSQAPNGVNELLVAELMAWCSAHGIRRVSLNFAFFRRVFAEAEDVSAGPLTRLNSQLLGRLDRYWQVERLYLANAKYHPTWQSRYVCLPSIIDLLPVALACARAEGFLPVPPWIARSEPAGTLDADHLARVRVLETSRPPVPSRAPGGDQSRARLDHLAALAAAGRPGYPLGRLEAVPLSAAPVLSGTVAGSGPWPAAVVGRVRAVRHHGGVCFVDLVDGLAQVQLVLDAARLGRMAVADFARWVDPGDLVRVASTPVLSRTGTPSLQVESWQMLAKALRPVPWQGFEDPEARLRNRSLDLVVHPREVEVLRARSRAIEAVRTTMASAGFLEVETPLLQTVHGGASARPFRTTINAYRTDLVLRIAPELALKRLLVGGLGPIFELGRNFRNEGADATHNPEFTVVEAYQPFADYTDMRLLTERLVRAAAVAVHGREVLAIRTDAGVEWLDISGEWPVVGVCEAVSAAVGRPVAPDTDLEVLLDLAREHGVHVRDGWGPGALVDALYEELVEPTTVLPTFYTDFPAETSTLAGPHRNRPGLVERWDLVIDGMELGTAYSELTDPLEQRRRLVEQSWKAAAGDPEAMEVDEDFLAALEIGMPPAGGLGIGIDRLVMVLTGRPIRDVLAFPFVRPRS